MQSLHSYNEESKAKRFVLNSAREKRLEMLQKTAMNRLKSFYKSHRGNQKAKILAEAFFRAKIGKVYFKFWRLNLAAT